MVSGERLSKSRFDVLLVDDCAEFLRAIASSLGRHVDVRAVGSLAAAERELAARVPDIVVCDAQVGDDDGLLLLERIASERPSVRRVLLSGMMFEEDDPVVTLAAPHALLRKPVTTEALLSALGVDVASARR